MAQSVERIAGEHHYAEINGSTYTLYRSDDNERVCAGKPPKVVGVRLGAESAIKDADDQANHFINLGAARERQRINEMAAEVGELRVSHFASDDLYGEPLPEYVELNASTGDTFIEALESATATLEE